MATNPATVRALTTDDVREHVLGVVDTWLGGSYTDSTADQPQFRVRLEESGRDDQVVLRYEAHRLEDVVHPDDVAGHRFAIEVTVTRLGDADS